MVKLPNLPASVVSVRSTCQKSTSISCSWNGKLVNLQSRILKSLFQTSHTSPITHESFQPSGNIFRDGLDEIMRMRYDNSTSRDLSSALTISIRSRAGSAAISSARWHVWDSLAGTFVAKLYGESWHDQNSPLAGEYRCPGRLRQCTPWWLWPSIHIGGTKSLPPEIGWRTSEGQVCWCKPHSRKEKWLGYLFFILEYLGHWKGSVLSPLKCLKWRMGDRAATNRRFGDRVIRGRWVEPKVEMCLNYMRNVRSWST